MYMCVCVSVCVILITLLAGEGGNLFVEACNVHGNMSISESM